MKKNKLIFLYLILSMILLNVMSTDCYAVPGSTEDSYYDWFEIESRRTSIEEIKSIINNKLLNCISIQGIDDNKHLFANDNLHFYYKLDEINCAANLVVKFVNGLNIYFNSGGIGILEPDTIFNQLDSINNSELYHRYRDRFYKSYSLLYLLHIKAYYDDNDKNQYLREFDIFSSKLSSDINYDIMVPKNKIEFSEGNRMMSFIDKWQKLAGDIQSGKYK